MVVKTGDLLKLSSEMEILNRCAELGERRPPGPFGFIEPKIRSQPPISSYSPSASLRLAAGQSLTVASAPEVAIMLPSLENETPVAGPMCCSMSAV